MNRGSGGEHQRGRGAAEGARSSRGGGEWQAGDWGAVSASSPQARGQSYSAEFVVTLLMENTVPVPVGNADTMSGFLLANNPIKLI